MIKVNGRHAVIVMLMALLLSACGGEAAPTPLPTTVGGLATALPSPTVATAATLPPPVVAEPATATPPGMATSTAEPLSTEAPPVIDPGPGFGPDRNRLTGEIMANPAVLERRPIACKLSNFPAQYTRPQSGLNSADLLFEHMTEGGLTRFTAIFYGTAPDDIGPIRSARLIDVELPAMYDAALCFSGASTGVSQRLFASDFAARILRPGAIGYYRTGADKPYEHTFYANPFGLWEALDSSSQNRAPAFGSQMAFSVTPPAGGQPATAITVDYRSENVFWRYDAGNGRYWRWSDGVPHLDGDTGEQVNFKNVVVVRAVQVDDGNICEEVRDGRCVALSVEIQLWGRGNAVVFRDGQAYDVTWRRENRNDMLTFYDAAGQPFPLQIGNIAFQLMPANLTGFSLTYE